MSEAFRRLTIASGQTAAAGNTILITPTAGNRLRISCVSYNPAAAVEVAFRFGAAGTLWLRNNISANSVIAKDFGDYRYLEGGVDEALILNLSAAVSINWTCFYTET